MVGIAIKITLSEKQEDVLVTLLKSRTAPSHLQQRASILLYYAQGKTNIEITDELQFLTTSVTRIPLSGCVTSVN
jgi:DNA-binding NarL/FixJ family response regulator